MEAWLEWARGPAFVFAFSFMVLGLVRHVVLTVAAMYKHLRRAGDPSLAYSKLTRTTLDWMVPVRKIKNEIFYSITSVIFHVAILIVPVFLGTGGHVRADLPALIETACRETGVPVTAVDAVGEDQQVLLAMADYCLQSIG